MPVNTLLKVLEQLLHKIKANRRREMGYHIMRNNLIVSNTRTKTHFKCVHVMYIITYLKQSNTYFIQILSNTQHSLIISLNNISNISFIEYSLTLCGLRNLIWLKYWYTYIIYQQKNHIIFSYIYIYLYHKNYLSVYIQIW